MAAITLLTPAQIAERQQKPTGRSGRRRSEERTRIIEEYKAIIRDAQPGAGADVVLDAGEDKKVVRQNLKAAADDLAKVIEFRPIKDPSRLHLRFITAEEKALKPRRTGRPRKQQPEAEIEQVQEPEIQAESQPEVSTRSKRQTRKARTTERTE